MHYFAAGAVVSTVWLVTVLILWALRKREVNGKSALTEKYFPFFFTHILGINIFPHSNKKKNSHAVYFLHTYRNLVPQS